MGEGRGIYLFVWLFLMTVVRSCTGGWNIERNQLRWMSDGQRRWSQDGINILKYGSLVPKRSPCTQPHRTLQWAWNANQALGNTLPHQSPRTQLSLAGKGITDTASGICVRPWISCQTRNGATCDSPASMDISTPLTKDLGLIFQCCPIPLSLLFHW